jgi:hypothetical protein
MNTLLVAYEASALGAAARGTVWLYPVANLLHVLGACLLLGAVAVFDVAVLRANRAALAIGRVALPIAAAGLALQLLTGLVLFAAEATTMAYNPAFLAKIAALVVGIANLALFHRRFGAAMRAGAIPEGAAAQAVVSLAAWTVAVLAGRGIAYL